MTNRITQAPVRTLVLTALMASLAGCGMISSVIDSDRVDYKSAKKARPLDVPPDLTQLERDNRYAVPDPRGVATASATMIEQLRQQVRIDCLAPYRGAAPATPPTRRQ